MKFAVAYEYSRGYKFAEESLEATVWAGVFLNHVARLRTNNPATQASKTAFKAVNSWTIEFATITIGTMPNSA